MAEGIIRKNLTTILIVLIQVHIIMNLLPQIGLSITFPLRMFGRVLKSFMLPIKFMTGYGVEDLINHNA